MLKQENYIESQNFKEKIILIFENKMKITPETKMNSN